MGGAFGPSAHGKLPYKEFSTCTPDKQCQGGSLRHTSTFSQNPPPYVSGVSLV